MHSIEAEALSSPAGAQWARVGARHHHGICVPLFSLHSRESCGIGEFTDLIPLFRWCSLLGMDVIQTLPLNDPGKETSPYSALSAFALNPLHLGLKHLPRIEASNRMKELLHELQILNTSPRVDYPRVLSLKDEYLRHYFQNVYPTLSDDGEYSLFCKNNPWAKEYALFKTLKIKTNWQSWQKWPSDWKNISPETFEQLLEMFDEEVSYHMFLQHLCFKQFKVVKEKARDYGIFLKGDIPILLSKESADVWAHRSLFDIELSAGAPPDMYNPEGQGWGFPLYNWEEMEKQDYLWWQKRLEVASRLYDIYRIDHVVGFYRIWAVPFNGSPKEGWFLPRDTAKWINQGEKILRRLLTFSHMLPIGEDLGIVPEEVKQNLRSLGICGTKVIRWERMWEENKRFINYRDYEPLSMTTVSTHDSEPLRLWWQNQTEEAKEFCKFKGWMYKDELSDDRGVQILNDSHHTASLFHINLLQEYLACVPGMTSSDPNKERVNVPGTISDKNWAYRFIPSVEEIVENGEIQMMFHQVLGKPLNLKNAVENDL